MATEGTFNPNSYTREHIALALRRGLESEAQFTQLRTLITAQAATIAGIEGDISDLQQMATLEERLLTPISWDSNILSISQEDISIDGASGDTAYLSTDGTVHVTKSSTTRKMTVDFSRVYIPRSIGSTINYNFGVFGIPDEDVVCTIYVNDKLCVSTKEDEGDVWLVPGIDVFNGVFRIEISASKTVNDLVLKPYVRSTNAEAWTESDWEPFFPSLTWITSLAKTNSDNKILFEGSRNGLDLIPNNLTVSSANVTASLDTGKITVSKSGSSSETVTISGISLSAGTYWFNNMGDEEAGVTAMETKLMDGETVITTDRRNGAAVPNLFTLDTDKTGLSLVIEIASDAEFGDIFTLPYVTTIQYGLTKYSWEPFYPSLMDVYRGMS